jgi:ribosomal protein S17E
MPVYEYQGKHYDLSTTDPAEAKSKIMSHLGVDKSAAAPTPAPAPTAAPTPAPAKKSAPVPYSMFGSQPNPEEEMKGYQTGAGGALTGLKTSVMEPIYGAGEFIPGDIGRASARGAKELEKEYKQAKKESPIPTMLGYGGGIAAQMALPVGELAKGATTAGTIGKSALTGAGFGALTPTGEQDYNKRIEKKVSPTVLGAALGGGVASLPSLGRSLLGTTQPEITELAKQYEAKGIKFEPAQLKKDKPLGSPGFREADKANNEKILTKEATKPTGVETENITPKFLGDRMSALGKNYDKIFGRNFEIDQNLVKTLQKMKQFEVAVNPTGVGPIKSTANNIIERFNDEVTKAQIGQIENRLKKILGQQGRGGVSPITRLQRDWPNIKKASDGGAPAWAKDIETIIHDLSKDLGLVQTPQVWVSSPRRRSLFGMATGDGHIIINETLDPKGAVATALHEFGHQAEFQLFAHAPHDVKSDVIRAYHEQNNAIPKGKLTTEQYRPLTAEKYGKGSREQVATGGFETYLRNFKEWFAEQTSRFLTSNKAPTNKVEKFFKGIADHWKEVYNRVKGYLPMTESIEKFYRSNWKGDLLNEAVPSVAKSGEPTAIAGEGLTASINGKEFQLLRSNMQRIARTAADGQDRARAAEFVKVLDEQLIKDPKLLDELRTTNRQYAATATLAEGIEKGFVSQGKISAQGLGNHLAQTTYGFGSGTSKHPLYDLGYAGRALNMRSRKEGVQFPDQDIVSVLAGRGKQLLGSALMGRTQMARNLQRKLTENQKP